MKKKKIILSIVIALILLLLGVQDSYATTMEPFHNFTGLYLETENAKIGENVYVDFHGDVTDLESVKVELLYENKSFIVEVNDLETANPYFVVPEGIKTGVTYEMISIIVECSHSETRYITIKGNDNFTNCFGKKYLYVENEVDVKLTSLSLGSHYTTIKKGDLLWLIAEFTGDQKPEVVTIEVTNKENPEMSSLAVLRESNGLQYIDVFENVLETDLANGTYYISAVHINVDNNVDNYVKYSIDETERDSRKLDFYVEFEINNNSLKLSNLSLASHYTVMKPGYKLWLDVEIKGKGTIDLVTMIVRNKENPEICALLSLKNESYFQYIDVFDIGTQEKLKDGTYYISDLYINPNREDYIRYTLDECSDDRKLEFYVEFEIDAEEENSDVNIKEENTETEDNRIPEREENRTEDNTKEPEEDENRTEVNTKEPEKDENDVDNKIPEKEENTDITINDSDEDNLKQKIYELLLKLLELLTKLENKQK